jgi:hypothetical protein
MSLRWKRSMKTDGKPPKSPSGFLPGEAFLTECSNAYIPSGIRASCFSTGRSIPDGMQFRKSRPLQVIYFLLHNVFVYKNHLRRKIHNVFVYKNRLRRKIHSVFVYKNHLRRKIHSVFVYKNHLRRKIHNVYYHLTWRCTNGASLLSPLRGSWRGLYLLK